MMYQAILFDMDGVIINSEPLHVAAFQAVLGQYGLALSEDDYKHYFAGKTDESGFRDYLDFINLTVDLQVIMQEKAEEYVRLAVKKLAGYPGVADLIQQLSQKTQLALVTGSSKVEADTALAALDITDCFAVIVSADDVVNGKPEPEGYLQAVARLGVDPSQCVIIEDSPSGIRAAKAAGIQSIGVTNTHSAEELRGADVVVRSLDLSMF